jgi:hypothetical protein
VVGLSMAERKAITKQMAKRYEKASKKQKGRMLDELCALTGWTRRHARRSLLDALTAPAARPRRPRPRTYGPEVIEPLKLVWATLNGPAGKRLAPFMAQAVQALERHGELSLREQVRTKLLSMSSATIDRALAPERARLRIKGRSGTKPGSILKRQIPIRTFAQWDDARPGFCEVDLVAHDGGTPWGEFCQTLDLTCVATGWTEPRALPNKAQRWVHEAVDEIAEVLPFPLLGLDSDNGAEFINMHLFRYCAERGITFTRSRPYRKNDNCYVEQKNWPVVRQQVGYARYDTPAELEALKDLYRVLRLYVNFFQPQMKLVAKTRRGAKVIKRFDQARTPYQRVLESPHVGEEPKRDLRETYLALNPAQLKRDLASCQARLLDLANDKPSRGKEVNHPPGPRPRVSSRAETSRTSLVMQPVPASRTS